MLYRFFPVIVLFCAGCHSQCLIEWVVYECLQDEPALGTFQEEGLPPELVDVGVTRGHPKVQPPKPFGCAPGPINFDNRWGTVSVDLAMPDGEGVDFWAVRLVDGELPEWYPGPTGDFTWSCDRPMELSWIDGGKRRQEVVDFTWAIAGVRDDVASPELEVHVFDDGRPD